MRFVVARTLVVAAVTAMAISACAPIQSPPLNVDQDDSTGTIRVWLFSEVNQDAKQAVVDEAVGEFSAAHPGVTVDVQYIPVESRAERFKAAFNDPSSAPDVAEFGNTDLAAYVDAGGLLDITTEVSGWTDWADIDPTIALTSAVGGRNYGVPWYVGVRALYYRTDIFTELGLTPPTTLEEVATVARTIRAAHPELLGIAAGGKYQFAAMPYLWAYGGDLATVDPQGNYRSALTTPESREGISAYADLLADDICPVQTCAEMAGGASVQQFVAGKAAMVIGGDFNQKAVLASEQGARYAVVPLPGLTAGSIAPAFAGGNMLGVMRGSTKHTLAFEFVELLGGKVYAQKMFDAMGNLPTFTDVQAAVAAANPSLDPFIATLQAGTKFVPVTPAWATIDAQAVFPSLLQKVATGQQTVEEATSAAGTTMNDEFGRA